jgi:hypothetical protein
MKSVESQWGGGNLNMIFKLGHAIVITLLLYCIMGMNNPGSVQIVDSGQPTDSLAESETVAELEFKELPDRLVRAINLGR